MHCKDQKLLGVRVLDLANVRTSILQPKHLAEVVPEVVQKDLLLHVVGLLHDAKHVGNLLLLSCQLNRLPIVQHLDIAGQASVLWGKEHTSMVQLIPLDLFVLVFGSLQVVSQLSTQSTPLTYRAVVQDGSYDILPYVCSGLAQ